MRTLRETGLAENTIVVSTYALHTILCLGTGRFEPGERDALRSVAIGSLFPIEAVNLFYPQTQDTKPGH